MIIVGVSYGSRAGFVIEIESFYSEKVLLNRPAQYPFALMSSRASFSVVVVLLWKLSPSSD